MKNTALVVVAVLALAGIYLLAKKKTAIAPNYAYGVGAVGATSHAQPIITGGQIAAIGSTLSQWFGGGSSSPASIAPDANTPYLGNGTISNPVYPAPSVLPYSYKQQVVDTPGVLGTADLFTPSNVTGSSGAYADQGGYGGSNADSGSADYLNSGFV
jgi:hypothetical protein